MPWTSLVASGMVIQGMHGMRSGMVTVSATWGFPRMWRAFHELVSVAT